MLSTGMFKIDISKNVSESSSTESSRIVGIMSWSGQW